MKKTLLLVALAILAIGMTTLSFADAVFNPAQTYADLTGITLEEAYALHYDTAKTYGTLASEAGVYEAFFDQMIEAKITRINELVSDGKITEEQAATIIDALENCDGTQNHIIRETLGYGMGFGYNADGTGIMNGQGFGQGIGQGLGQGAYCGGTGAQLQDGTGFNGQNVDGALGTGYGRGRGMMGGRGMGFGN